MSVRHTSWRRALRAQARDTRVLLGESREALILFAAILAIGTLALRLFYVNPETGSEVDLSESFYATLGMIFFQPQLPFPENPVLRVLFLVIPLVGLVAVADGVLRFGVALVDKRSRGQKWQAAMATTYSNHIIVCGLGKVGFRVAQELLKMGRDVVGVEQNPEGRFVEQAQALGIPVLIADARLPETLAKAGVTRADVIIPATENELTNLDIALDARELNPEIKVVMRMFDPDLARRIEQGFGIHTAYSVSALAAPVFAAAAVRADVKASFYAGKTLLNVVEMKVTPGCSVDGRTVGDVEATYDISIVATYGDETSDVRPEPEATLRAGDRLLVLGSLEKLGPLNAAIGAGYAASA
jgi:Trk K+ transport system NAD-binding subunit